MEWIKEWLPLIVFGYTLFKDWVLPKLQKKKPKKQKRRPRQGKRRK